MKPSSAITPSKTPGSIEGFDLRLYFGCEELKIKAVDKMSGAGFSVAYLVHHAEKDAIKRELACDFAALALAAPALLKGAAALLAMAGDEEGALTVDRAEIRALFKGAVASARREETVFGDLSPAVIAAMGSKHQ